MSRCAPRVGGGTFGLSIINGCDGTGQSESIHVMTCICDIGPGGSFAWDNGTPEKAMIASSFVCPVGVRWEHKIAGLLKAASGTPYLINTSRSLVEGYRG